MAKMNKNPQAIGDFIVPQFVSEVFNAWDLYADRITFIDFTWLNDITDTEADQFVEVFGLQNSPDREVFKSYFASLGLRTNQGTDKEAFLRLQSEIALRQNYRFASQILMFH